MNNIIIIITDILIRLANIVSDFLKLSKSLNMSSVLPLYILTTNTNNYATK